MSLDDVKAQLRDLAGDGGGSSDGVGRGGEGGPVGRPVLEVPDLRRSAGVVGVLVVCVLGWLAVASLPGLGPAQRQGGAAPSSPRILRSEDPPILLAPVGGPVDPCSEIQPLRAAAYCVDAARVRAPAPEPVPPSGPPLAATDPPSHCGIGYMICGGARTGDAHR